MRYRIVEYKDTVEVEFYNGHMWYAVMLQTNIPYSISATHSYKRSIPVNFGNSGAARDFIDRQLSTDPRVPTHIEEYPYGKDE